MAGPHISGSNQYRRRPATAPASPVPAGPDLVAQAGPGQHDPRYLRAVKQLVGLNQYDRQVWDLDGLPVALYIRGWKEPEDSEYIKGLAAAVSQAAGGLPVQQVEIDQDDDAIHIGFYPACGAYRRQAPSEESWDKLYDKLYEEGPADWYR